MFLKPCYELLSLFLDLELVIWGRQFPKSALTASNQEGEKTQETLGGLT